ncbi:MAG: SDR family NAD(P)-dependent oxidoreductase [Thermoplasmata archaeon]
MEATPRPPEVAHAESANPWRDRVVLVVGASRGIGAATAKLFARGGARVVLASRDEAALQRVAREIEALGGEVIVQPVDLAEAGSVHRLGMRIERDLGRLDVAFNNAGEGLPPSPLAEIAPEAFERVLRVTVTGTFLAMRVEIPLMLRSGGGAIVNMSSTAGLSGYPGGGAYITAKHAVLGLTRSAALDYAARGIRVNAVAPGPIDTERLSGLPESYREQVRQAVPMRRIGLPEEVGRVVLWLGSEESRFVTGATILVDGGRLAGVA